MAETIINSNQLRASGDTSSQTLINENQVRQSGDSSSQTLLNKNQIAQSSGIEYLQSDGAIYIPLCENGETLNVKSFTIDIECLDNTEEQLYLGRFAYPSNVSANCYCLNSRFAPDWAMRLYSGGYSPEENFNDAYQNRLLLNLSFSSVRTFDSNYGLFGGDWNGGIKYSKCKIWSCILYNGNGNEVSNLLPKEENGVLGMYDSVRQKFIAGVGSGSFIAG